MILASVNVRRFVAIAAITALSACSGGGSSSIPSSAGAATPGSGNLSSSSSLTSTLVPSAKFTSNVTREGLATTIGTLVMHVMVKQQNAQGLISYAAAVSNPQDGRYRHFLTPSQIGDQFGASAGDYAGVAQYFAANGLKVGAYPQRLSLTVAGPVSGFQKALGTTFSFYRTTDGKIVIAPTTAIRFSKPLPVASIADAVADPMAKHAQFVVGVGGGPQQGMTSGNSPEQIAAAFDFNSAYAAGYTGKGINVGIIGTGPIQQADFASYKSMYAWAGSATLTQVNVGSAAAANIGGSPTATPPAVTAPCTISSNPNIKAPYSPTASCNPEDGEAQIDTEQAALARDANILFYLAYVPVECGDPTQKTCPSQPDPNTGAGYSYQGLAESDDEIQQAIADNTADVLSLSYGSPEILTSFDQNPVGTYDPKALEPLEFAALASEGIAVFVSSGDDGAQTCAMDSISYENAQCVSYPAGDVSVTSVGGITAPLNNAGQFIGPITVWGQQTGNGASGGGVSTIVPAPSWETGPGASSGGRNQPDVSLDGDPGTGVGVVVNTGLASTTHAVYGGTSVAAPEMAAMWALVLQACATTPACSSKGQGPRPFRLGNAAPYFWRIYNNSSQYGTTFYDVVFGNNGQVGCVLTQSCNPNLPLPTPAPGYSAGTGYDHASGVGVPFARHLIQAVVGV